MKLAAYPCLFIGITLVRAPMTRGAVIIHPGYAQVEAEFWSDADTGLMLDKHVAEHKPVGDQFDIDLYVNQGPFLPQPDPRPSYVVAHARNSAFIEGSPDEGYFLYHYSSVFLGMAPEAIPGLHLKGQAAYEFSFTLTEPGELDFAGTIEEQSGSAFNYITGQILVTDEQFRPIIEINQLHQGLSMPVSLPAGEYWFRTDLNVEQSSIPLPYPRAEIEVGVEMRITPEPTGGLLLVAAVIAACVSRQNRAIGRVGLCVASGTMARRLVKSGN